MITLNRPTWTIRICPNCSAEIMTGGHKDFVELWGPFHAADYNPDHKDLICECCIGAPATLLIY